MNNYFCANKLSLYVKKTHNCVDNPKKSIYEVKGNVEINNEFINQIGKYGKDESVQSPSDTYLP